MARVLVAWADDTSTNLGLRVLAQGASALVSAALPGAEVVLQDYGHGPAPTNIGVPRTLAREAVGGGHGLATWVRGFDLVLDMRGGDSFTDIYGLTRLTQQCAFAEFVHHLGVPLVLGPQTLGPFTTRRGHLLGARGLRLARLVMARDPASAAVAARMGRPVDVRATDVVFALPVPAPSGDLDVVLNVSGLLWGADDHVSARGYRAEVEELIHGLRGQGREVTLLAHVLDSSSPDNDVPVVRELAQRHDLPAVVPEDLGEVRALLRGARVVVGSRMHACLNALSVGTPCVAMAYSRKFAPLFADLGWDRVVDLRVPGVAERVLALVDEASRAPAQAQVATARGRAEALLGDAVTALRGVL